MITEQSTRKPVHVAQYQVRVVDPATDHRWAAFVESHPQGLAYHHPTYLQALTDAFGYAPLHLACEDAAGNLQGVLPLVSWRGSFGGRQLWSLPRTPSAGPLATDDAATSALVQAAIDLVKQEVGHRLQIKSVDSDLAAGQSPLVRVEWWPVYAIDLPDGPDPPRFSKSRRRGISRALRAGVTVRDAGSVADVRAWYRLYLHVHRRKVSPPLPLRFFEALWHRMHPAGLLRLLLAERHAPATRELLAGTILMQCSQTVVDAFAADRHDARHHYPSDLILGTALSSAWEAGFRIYDLGYAPPGEEGVAQYKRVWGATPRPTYRYYYPTVHDTLITHGRFQERRLAMRLARETWRRLPLGVIELIGGLVYARM